MVAEGLPDDVRRVIKRGDLMMLVRDAGAAVDIARTGKLRDRTFRHQAELFTVALREHRAAADEASGPHSDTIRVVAWDNAGVIVRTCRLLGVVPEGMRDAVAAGFHRRVLAVFEARAEERLGRLMDHDLYNGRTLRYRAIRDLRLDGDYAGAIELASQDEVDFLGNGADTYGFDYQYEIAAAMLLNGAAADVAEMLRTTGQRYREAVAGSRFDSQYLVDFAQALAAWAQGAHAEAAEALARSQRWLRDNGSIPGAHDIDDLLLSIARAELAAAGDADPVGFIEEALHATERVRARWQVVSRSASPLATAFRHLYGDLAAVAAATARRATGNGETVIAKAAAELGLRVALSAKQSGFATRIRSDAPEISRTGRTGRRLIAAIDSIVSLESGNMHGAGLAAETIEQRLNDLRLELEGVFSPMLASTVLPVPDTVERIVDVVGQRYALDCVALPDLLLGGLNWFQTLVEPDGTVTFRQLPVAASLTTFLAAANAGDLFGGDVDWVALGEALLPRRLRTALTAATGDPVRLVISAHAALSVVPWAALGIGDGLRLVERAIISQTPVLTALSGAAPGPVTGPALIQLVAREDDDPGRLAVRTETMSWRLRHRDDGTVPLSSCELELRRIPAELPGSFVAALSDGHWGFAHIATHGYGDGLGQTLRLPGEPVSAARALTLRWPAALLMASCHVGRLLNPEHAEPLNFVMAALVGGAECVVAGIDEMHDVGGGYIAADIVRLVRGGDLSLDAALRHAQLRKISRWPVHMWAVYAAYVR
ncbi:hypothetical protein PSN13_01421 [Micromonospora saelicesensis]|uniref:CHAT domain-containing protein n=1 Tax=Micromonospora saelicesensis TaxID=285676 RepID=A0A328NVF9_9ACTN|nr:CHAT domain-containing protein [Micromonospora saelicesensis]RAO37439.1 hypothetical protein PSN13_01421 [Micromonospora saelicesensis]